MKRICSFVIFMLHSLQGYSQGNIGTIFTDRPSQTDAVLLLPQRVFQIEMGYFWSDDEVIGDKTTTMTIPNLFLKYGVLEWLELRAGMALYYEKQQNASVLTTATEAGPIFVAPKFKLLEPNGLVPRTSFTFYLTIPQTGTGRFRAKNGAFSTRLLMENIIADNLTLAYSLGTDSDFSGKPDGFYSIMLSTSFGQLGAFAEVFSNVRWNLPNPVGLDGGISFTVTDNFAIDLAIGVALNTYATDVFLNSGIGYRLH